MIIHSISPDSTFLMIVSIFCISLVTFSSSFSSNRSLISYLSFFVPPPMHPITGGITRTLKCSLLSLISKHNCWYFCIFSSLLSVLLLSFGHAMSIMNIFLFSCSSKVRSGLLAEHIVCIRCSQSQHNFLPFFSIIFPFSHFSFHHFLFSGRSPVLIAHCTANTFKALSCRLTYSVPAIFSQPANKCCTVSLHSLSLIVISIICVHLEVFTGTSRYSVTTRKH